MWEGKWREFIFIWGDVKVVPSQTDPSLPSCALSWKVSKGNIWAQSPKTDGLPLFPLPPPRDLCRRGSTLSECNDMLTKFLLRSVCSGTPAIRAHPVSAHTSSVRMEFSISNVLRISQCCHWTSSYYFSSFTLYSQILFIWHWTRGQVPEMNHFHYCGY